MIDKIFTSFVLTGGIAFGILVYLFYLTAKKNDIKYALGKAETVLKKDLKRIYGLDDEQFEFFVYGSFIMSTLSLKEYLTIANLADCPHTNESIDKIKAVKYSLSNIFLASDSILIERKWNIPILQDLVHHIQEQTPFYVHSNHSDIVARCFITHKKRASVLYRTVPGTNLNIVNFTISFLSWYLNQLTSGNMKIITNE